jgi:NACHT domain
VRRGWSWLRRLGWSLTVVGLAVLAVGLPLGAWRAQGHAFDRLVGWATIFGLSVGAIGLLLMFVDRRRQASDVSAGRLDAVADDLNGQVLDQESRALSRLLATGRAGSVAANVGFAERLVVFAEASSGRSGRLDEVGLFYRQHASGARLVILGEPGSGKTVLALQLLIQQAEARRNEPEAQTRARLPVPVRANLPTWNTDVPFLQWLIDRLVTGYGMRIEEAAALVNKRRVLPVLDGLDEMDSPDRPPERAAAAVTALNEYVAGHQGALVLTCRHDEYVTSSERLRPATEVVIRPLDAEQIRDYIRREVGPIANNAAWVGWLQLLDRLDFPTYAQLLQALSTPWRLTLAISYNRAGGDPTLLLPTEQERSKNAAGTCDNAYATRVADSLLREFVPARTRVYSDGRYRPDEVTSWLRTVARHLAWQQDHGMSGTDIVLHQWWHIAGEARVRRWHARINLVLASLFVLLMGLLVNGGSVGRSAANVRSYLNGFPALDRPYLLAGVLLVVTLIVVPATGWTIGGAADIAPAQVDLQQLRTFQGRRQLLVRLAVGLAGGLAVGLAGGLATGLATELPIGLAFGLVVGLAFGLATGLASGLAGNAWLRYVLALRLVHQSKPLPPRFGRFLTWCCAAGIMRETGTAYQFRHLELRDWLRGTASADLLAAPYRARPPESPTTASAAEN